MKSVLILLLLALCLPVQADSDGTTAIYKCTSADGEVLYTNHPCVNSRPEVVELQSPVPGLQRSKGVFVSQQPVIHPWIIITITYLVMSLLGYLLYWIDKHRSIKGEWRIPEKTLHAVELLGGWPGAWVAQQHLRHKTRKVSYQASFWLIVVLHLLIWTDFLTDHALWHRMVG